MLQLRKQFKNVYLEPVSAIPLENWLRLVKNGNNPVVRTSYIVHRIYNTNINQKAQGETQHTRNCASPARSHDRIVGQMVKML